MKLSLIIPAHNEEENIRPTVERLARVLREEAISFELLVVDDNSTDGTAAAVLRLMDEYPELVLLSRKPPRGFGRAVRTGLAHFTGDAVALFMADCSDSPEDVVRCFRLIEEGNDCVYGSRFMRGSRVVGYPPLKCAVNRIVNRMLQVLFLTRHGDLTNAFKMYRAEVIHAIQPLYACHFNVTIELSLSALVRGFRIACIPISWNGRSWGCSKLRLREMGRRYLCTLLKIWFEKLLIGDDLSNRGEVPAKKTTSSECSGETELR